MHVIKDAGEIKHMSVIRLAATVWRAIRARSSALVSPATDVTDILEVGRVSPNLGRARQRKNPLANVNDVARIVDGS